jgi:hypothetical protein
MNKGLEQHIGSPASLDVSAIAMRDDLQGLEDLSSSSDASPHRTPEKSPFESPRTPPFTPKISEVESKPVPQEDKAIPQVAPPRIAPRDLTILRRRLKDISEKHYKDLWAENGPMWTALKGKFTGQQKFEEFNPEIKRLTQEGTPSEQFTQFILAFLEANIRGLPLRLSYSNKSEITPLNDLLTYVLDSLMAMMEDCRSNKSTRFLTSDQENELRNYYYEIKKSLPATKNPDDKIPDETIHHVQIQYLTKMLNLMTNKQREDFYLALQSNRPELFKAYRHEGVKSSSFRSVFELRPDEKLDFAFDQLARLFRGEVDDFSLFNEAYGLATQPVIAGTQKSYITNVNNGVIVDIRNKFFQPEDLERSSENHRWEALWALTMATTAYNGHVSPDRGQNTYVVNDLSIIYSWLENTLEPLLFLRPHEDCKKLVEHITSLYEKSFDEVFRCLYFTTNQQHSLAEYLSLEPMKKRNYFPKLKKGEETPLYKRRLAAVLEKFENQELTSDALENQLQKLSVQFRPKSLLVRFWHLLVAAVTPGFGNFAALEQQYDDMENLDKTKDPVKSLSGILGIKPLEKLTQFEFIERVAQKRKEANSLPPYKKQLAEIIENFANRKLNHVEFQAELKKLLAHYQCAPPLEDETEQQQRKQDLIELKGIIASYKKIRSDCDITLSQSAVDAKLESTVRGIKNQVESKIVDIHWLKEQAKDRLERLAETELFKKVQEKTTQEKLEHAAKQQSTPLFSNALHFFASGINNNSSVDLDQGVIKAIAAHRAIHNAPKGQNLQVPVGTRITRALLIESLAQGRKLEGKAQVRSYLINTLVEKDHHTNMIVTR